MLVAACIAAAAGILPVAAAAPAQATTIQCLTWLDFKGYIVGPKVRTACGYTSDVGWGFCVAGLVNAGVRQTDAITACDLASR
ncbi:hypothetical protein GCM10017674_03440 [Streptomyces gardneri]|nr:hypothetical protein GCM10017674_03440 [Streptomyces gardneri]